MPGVLTTPAVPGLRKADTGAECSDRVRAVHERRADEVDEVAVASNYLTSAGAADAKVPIADVNDRILRQSDGPKDAGINRIR